MKLQVNQEIEVSKYPKFFKILMYLFWNHG